MKRKLSAITISAALALGTQTSTATAQELWIGQIVMGGWNFCPSSTARADGALLPISSNSALFSLLGCTYGGDCRTSFALPDLRGRIAMQNGNGPGLQPVTSAVKISAGPATATTGEGNVLSNGAAGTYTAIAAPTKNLKDGTVSVSVASIASPAGGANPPTFKTHIWA